MPKQSIRTQMLMRRRQCDANFCREASHIIQVRLLTLDEFAAACCVALYSAVHCEVETGLVARKALASGKTIAYPRVEGDHLVFVQTSDPAELKPGAFNIPEPGDGRVLAPEEVDLCIVPGVAFDCCGHRLGYGRGFFDRFLARQRQGQRRIGFSYDFQVVDTLPVSGHDQALSMLITEKRVLDFSHDCGRSARGL
jgi:5-formyltetrahydrofolate cyclo-ligase